MSNQKPLLIINCCANKKAGTHSAIELYEGAIFTLLRKNCDDIRDLFDVYILSAEHGLISANTVISYYNTEMSKPGTAEFDEYIHTHKKGAVNLLKSILTENRRCYICLTKKYQAALDTFMEQGFKARLAKLDYCYVLRNCGGIGLFKARVKGIIDAEKSRCHLKPVIFKSGVANADEAVAYMSADCAIGSSLAYFSSKPYLKFFVGESLKTHDCFVDNGIITAIKSGKFVKPKEVFANYKNIVNELAPVQAKRLSIVVPDNFLFPYLSQQVVKENVDDILWLLDRCQVILVVHSCINIVSHARVMLDALNNHPNIVLGVPSRLNIETGIDVVGKINPRLSLAQIESLLEMKVSSEDGKNKRKAWSNIHFLGASDKSGSMYKQRVELAMQYGYLNCHFDTNRTPAIMGSESESNLIGSVNLRYLRHAILHNKTLDDGLRDYDELDTDDSRIYPLFLDRLSDDLSEYLQIWNKAVPELAFSEIEVRDFKAKAMMDYDAVIEDLSDILMRIPATYLADHTIKNCWRMFVNESHYANNTEARIAAICKTMLDDSDEMKQPKPVALPLDCNDSLPPFLRHQPWYLPQVDYVALR
ncbi:DUF6884 domain-containing protein [Photobacterium leiognathi]|uniref:DUF6884 domain-containing protein n=1 Tax=Photobacterium leiognathi TaxID=553611 RepID=UPI0029827284|nr:DUF6884 domain-containing protein [Photobacterium leiognathi]